MTDVANGPSVLSTLSQDGTVGIVHQPLELALGKLNQHGNLIDVDI